MELPPQHAALLTALVRAGLHDDVARLTARLTDAHDRLEAARAALEDIPGLRRCVAELCRGADELADAVQATLSVDWRSVAAQEHGEQADGLHRAAAGIAEGAAQWPALVEAAEREAEAERAQAQAELDRWEAGVTGLLQAVAA